MYNQTQLIQSYKTLGAKISAIHKKAPCGILSAAQKRKRAELAREMDTISRVLEEHFPHS